MAVAIYIRILCPRFGRTIVPGLVFSVSCNFRVLCSLRNGWVVSLRLFYCLGIIPWRIFSKIDTLCFAFSEVAFLFDGEA